MTGTRRATIPAASAAARILAPDDARWVEFTRQHPDATPFHLPAWVSTVADCYRMRSFALTAQTPTGRILAGVPVIEVPSLRPGGARRWVSLPFTDHCPVLLTDGAGDAWSAALRAAVSTGRGVRRLELRAETAGVRSDEVAVRHVLTLTGDPDDAWRGFHRSQVQRNIRRAEREGVTVREATSADDLTGTFYRLHLTTRRRQGVPVQPRRLFELIWQRIIAPGLGTVLVAEHEGRPLAAAVFLRHNGTVIYKYGASDDAAWSMRPNHALFWHAIRSACAAGDTVFDWGRTDLDNAGLRAFKSSWGADEVPLRYTTVTAASLDARDQPSNSAQVRGHRAAELLGATIRHSPPWVCVALGEALYRFAA